MRVQHAVKPGVVAILASATLALSSCSTPQQVKWETYSPLLQIRIDSAAATRNCVALAGYKAAASRTSRAHRKATGISNRALENYVDAAQRQAGC